MGSGTTMVCWATKGMMMMMMMMGARLVESSEHLGLGDFQYSSPGVEAERSLRVCVSVDMLEL